MRTPWDRRRDRRRSTQLTVAAVALAVAVVAVVGFAPPSVAQNAELVITERGVGAAIVGSTVDQLADQLGSDFEIGDETRITVDFDGHVVSRDGAVVFRAVKADAPSDALTLFIVGTDDAATAEGVGPGTRVVDAEAIYGDATLRWNPDNEGREFVEFENQPPGRIQFRTTGIGDTTVGDYDSGEFETDRYDLDGRIAAVWVSCVDGVDCPDPGATGGVDDDDADGDDAEGDGTEGDDVEGDGAEGDDVEGDGAEGDGTEGEDADGDEAGGDGTDGEGTEGDGADGDEAEGDGATELPNTGSTEAWLFAVASLFVIVGGGALIAGRRFLAPKWLLPGHR